MWPPRDDLGFFIRALVQQKCSGIIRRGRSPVRRSLYFHEGRLVFAHSNVKREKLGFLLIQQGILASEAELQSILQAKGTERLGHYLVQQGMLIQQDLQRLLELQVRTIFTACFYDDAPFGWEERPQPVLPDLIVPVDLGALVEEVVLNDPRPEAYLRRLPETSWWITQSDQAVFRRAFFHVEDQLLRSQVIHPRRVQELLHQGGLPPQESARRLYLGLLFGYLMAHPPERYERVAPQLWSAGSEYLNPLPPDWEVLADRSADVTTWELFALPPDSPWERVQERYEQFRDWLLPIRYRKDLSPEKQAKIERLIQRVENAYREIRRSLDMQTPAFGIPIGDLSTETLLQRAETFIEQGRFEEANHLLTQYRTVLEKNGRFYYLMALALAHQGETQPEAEAYLQKALELEPFNWDYWVELAVLYKDMGQVQRAIETLERVLRQEPQHFRAQQLLRLYRAWHEARHDR
ncbi:MAG: tetratricopeptide repeat protein [Acidobacteria bacterium]|nr:tetratricopeptide repeat protein [Acidobacteriota bacterium]MDW7983151.1 tetratricopeptide repeat protein [Acidobacteriota bacterium]